MVNEIDVLNCALEGSNLIEAGAGTGKTYTIACLYTRLVIEKKLTPDKILVVTFTVPATEELRMRIRKRLREVLDAVSGKTEGPYDDLFLQAMSDRWIADNEVINLLQISLRSFDEAAIFTIHSFCQQILKENAFETGSLFDTELITDDSELLEGIVKDFWRMNFYDLPDLLTAYVLKNYSPGDFVRLLKKRSIDPDFRIVPENADFSIDRESVRLNDLYSAFNGLAEKWAECAEEVEKILTDSKSLNQTRYKSERIKGYCEKLTGYFSSGYPMSGSENLEKFTLTKILSAVNKNAEPPEHPFFALADEFMNSLSEIDEIFNSYDTYIKKEIFAFADTEVHKRKQKKNIRFFDDLITAMHKSLNSGSRDMLKASVRKRFSAALIDEFQDTDSVQYDIFTSLFNTQGHILFLIGDPKQAIYAFRGADIFSYLKAKDNVSTEYTLLRNWRSDPDLIKGVNTIFSSHERPFLYEKIPFNSAVPAEIDERDSLLLNGEKARPLVIWHLEKGEDKSISKEKTTDKIITEITSEITGLVTMGASSNAVIGERPLTPSDIAILVRSNMQGRQVKEELTKAGIPSVIYASDSIFASSESDDIYRILTAIADPFNLNFVRSALVTGICGFTGSDIERFQFNEDEWEMEADRFYDLHHMWIKNGFMSMFLEFTDMYDVRQRALSAAGGERMMTNILHLAELIHQHEHMEKPGTEGLLKWFGTMIDERSDEGESQLRLETDDRAVKIITIHKSKGLEFPVVFCPFVYEDSRLRDTDTYSFHDTSNNDKLTLNIGAGNDFYVNQAERENLAENLRLFYVALTRAKYLCYTAWGPINKAATSAPAYILHSDMQDEETVIENLEERFKDFSDHDIAESLAALERDSEGTIEIRRIESVPVTGKDEFSVETETLSGGPREWTREVKRTVTVSSYSSLVSSSSAASHEKDDGLPARIKKKAAGFERFIDFPSGPGAGTCLHEILEEIDFTIDIHSQKNTAEEKLRMHGFEEEWADSVLGMIESLVSLDLHPEENDLKLADVNENCRLNEMEFYFPINGFRSDEIRSLFGNDDKVIENALAGTEIKHEGGFIHGFIDLVFRKGDRYYIIDWKSNNLGSSIYDYTGESLEAAMKGHNYYLQYLLYSSALHAFLSRRLAGYSYEKNFGGIFYVFLRGISGEHGNTRGIFHDRPAEDILIKLADYFTV